MINQSHVVGRGEPLGSEVFFVFLKNCFWRIFFGKIFLEKFFWKFFFGICFWNLFCAENSKWKWKEYKLPQKDFIWSLQTKNGDVGWRNAAWTAKKLILAKNVHFRLQKWPFLTQNMRIFQKSLKLPQHQKWWCWVKKCGLHCEKMILTKNVHFWLQNWPFLTQNMGIFQNR